MSKFPNLRLHTRALELPQVSGGDDMTPEGWGVAAWLAAHLECGLAEWVAAFREHAMSEPEEAAAIVEAFAEFVRRDPEAP